MKSKSQTKRSSSEIWNYANKRWWRAVFSADYPENDEEHVTHPAVVRADFWRAVVHRLEG